MRLKLIRKVKSEENGDPIIITSSFGGHIKKLYPAPIGFTSIVFSNNPSLKDEALKMGWEFRLIHSKEMMLCNDEIISSLQSKYIKFLIFLEHFPKLFTGQPILYVDHKVEIAAEHIYLLQDMITKDKAVLIRNTPRFKSTIFDEVEDAMPFPRYSKSMPQTLEWVEKMKRERGALETVRIMNTGLIYYSNVGLVREVLNEVWQVCNSLNQPECQIIWAVLSQDIDELIQRVEWSDVGIEHKLPQ
jgi:hypothetical protein